jgi:TM2 domain-containing membrane protein YozV
MTQEQIDQLVLNNSEKILPAFIDTVRQRLQNADEATAQTAFSQTKNSTLMLVMSVLFGCLGVDRFMLGQKLLGILKLITGGGFFMWYIIDWFTVKDRTRKYNTKKILSTI